MKLVLLLVFVGLPFAEIAMFAWVGGQIGVAGTLALVVLGAALGVSLLRFNGRTIALRAQESLARGVAPSREIADGLLMLVAGVLLVVPGFITDLLALVILFPGVRGLIRVVLANTVRARAAAGQDVRIISFGSFQPPGVPPVSPGQVGRARDQEVIDDGAPPRRPNGDAPG